MNLNPATPPCSGKKASAPGTSLESTEKTKCSDAENYFALKINKKKLRLTASIPSLSTSVSRLPINRKLQILPGRVYVSDNPTAKPKEAIQLQLCRRLMESGHAGRT